MNAPNPEADSLLAELLAAPDPVAALVALVDDPPMIALLSDLPDFEAALVRLSVRPGCSRLVAAVRRLMPRVESRVDDSRPAILVDHEEARMVRDGIGVLAARADIFQRSGELVRVVVEDASPVIREIPATHARMLLSEHARWVVRTKDGDRPASPPKGVPEMVLSAKEWPTIRRLSGITTSPQLRPDGSVLASSGYDERTGLLAFIPRDLAIRVHDEPTQEEAAVALDILADLLREFPFAKPSDRSSALALLLAILARPAYTGPSPMFFVHGSTAGAGKSLLVEVLVSVATGDDVAREPYCDDDEELRKKITSILKSGTQCLLFDNVKTGTKVGQPCFDALLTADKWADRLLGGNQRTTFDVRMLTAITGNNIGVQGDMARRVHPCRLEPEQERPEEREGLRDLNSFARSNRGTLVSAALTILRGWMAAGEPRAGVRPWGSYEGKGGRGWTMVRHALIWAGAPDPCEGVSELRESGDDAGEILGDLLSGWVTAYGVGTKVKPMEIVDRWKYPTGSDVSNPLAAVLGANASSKGEMTTQRLGNFLGKYKGQWKDGRRLGLSVSKGARHWFVEER